MTARAFQLDDLIAPKGAAAFAAPKKGLEARRDAAIDSGAWAAPTSKANARRREIIGELLPARGSVHLLGGAGGDLIGALIAGFEPRGWVDRDANAEDTIARAADMGRCRLLRISCMHLAADRRRVIRELTVGGARPSVVVCTPPCTGFSGRFG